MFDLASISENSKIGYILEVDLEYPKELHDIHNDYPLCPEKVEYEMLSKYCKDSVDRYNIKVGGVKKLIPNRNDKVKYVVHYKNLIYYFGLGMKLIIIHRTLKFKQKHWLKVFTDFNTEKRRLSNDEFNKGLYELFNNCIYGKRIKNARKKNNVKLINDKKKYQKIVNRHNFMSKKIIDKNFVAVNCSKKILTLNKPIYVGFCILELSRLIMYQFHYDYVLKSFNNVNLLFRDTDSLVYEIRNGNVYEQCFKDKELSAFSGSDKNSIYFDDSNKKKLGKMKDEFNGNKIDEFVGVKSKMYSLISSDCEVNKAKGVNLILRHGEYVYVLCNKKVVRHKIKRILSEKHSIGT